MNAEQFISLADALREHALRNGRDMNASNLFVHQTLMRGIKQRADADADPLAQFNRDAIPGDLRLN
jgi:hypothetical protein